VKQIELRTYGDMFVAHVYISPFQEMPEAVVWGQRIFIHRKDLIYDEGMCAVAYDSEVPPHVGIGSQGN